MPRDLLWLNGNISAIEDGVVPVQDRGFLFSDGIYEVVLFYEGKPFMLREHLERWEFSARGIELLSPGTLEERHERLLELVAESGHKNAMIYGQLTRGVAKRNHLFPRPEVPPTEFWFVRAAPHHKPEHYENGVKLATHPDERWAHCQYKTISLLPNTLAKERAYRAGGYEALLVQADGTVTECSSSNAYCVRDGVVFTHPLAPCILGGITRQAVLAAAEALGIEVREEAVSLDQFRQADEAFLSSTTMEVMPVTLVDEVSIGSGKVGPVTKRLREGVREAVCASCG